MVNRLMASFQSHKWLSLIGIAIIVLIVVLSITGKDGVKEPAASEEAEPSRQVVTLDMFSELSRQVQALNSAMTELTRKIEDLKEQQPAVDAFLTGYAGEVGDLKSRVEIFDGRLSEFNAIFGRTELRLAKLEQAAEAAKESASVLEPEVQIEEPFTVSSLMRWGEQTLAVIKIPAGYQFLGVGDQLSGWQVDRIDLAEGKVLLRYLASGHQVMQSLHKDEKAGTL